MDDAEIVRLYWARDDRALRETAQKYSSYCKTIAKNILGLEEDAEECVNDAFLNAWNSIPPHRPQQLSTFLGKLTRNLAFNRYRHDRAEKRGGGELALILDELSECVSAAGDAEQTVWQKELSAAISSFVRGLPSKKRSLFVRRYWYADPVTKIAAEYALSPANVSKILERIRKQLRDFLIERGFEL